jgi:hypothetical protein
VTAASSRMLSVSMEIASWRRVSIRAERHRSTQPPSATRNDMLAMVNALRRLQSALKESLKSLLINPLEAEIGAWFSMP